jgi:uncharacterized protein (DUF983 family)
MSFASFVVYLLSLMSYCCVSTVVEKHSLEAYLVYSPVGLIVVGRVMRLAVMWRAVMWVVMVGWRMMGVVVVLFEVNDAVVE